MSDATQYPYPSPTTQQLEQHLSGSAVAAAAVAHGQQQQQQQDDTPPQIQDAPTLPTTTRRRRGEGPSSRGVANLTPDQLAKKRRNDREAQRAIRERTRGTIETLEKRIHDLETQQPFQELQAIIRSRDAIMAENEELKRRLANISALTQSLSGSHDLNDLASATSRQDPLPTSATPPSPHHIVELVNQHVTDADGFPQPHLHPELRHLADHEAATAALMSSQNHAADIAHDATSDQVQRSVADGELAGFLESALNAHNLASMPDNTLIAQTSPSPPLQALDDLAALSDESHSSTLDHLSQITMRILARVLPSMRSKSEQIAFFYAIYLLLRWRALPSDETFDLVPDFLKPTPTQRDHDYPAWIAVVPWPGMRDYLITSEPGYTFENLFPAIAPHFSVDWEYDEESCFQIDDQGNKTITLAFEEHVRDIDNWTLGQDFATQWPSLVQVGHVRVLEH